MNISPQCRDHQNPHKFFQFDSNQLSHPDAIIISNPTNGGEILQLLPNQVSSDISFSNNERFFKPPKPSRFLATMKKWLGKQQQAMRAHELKEKRGKHNDVDLVEEEPKRDPSKSMDYHSRNKSTKITKKHQTKKSFHQEPSKQTDLDRNSYAIDNNKKQKNLYLEKLDSIYGEIILSQLKSKSRSLSYHNKSIKMSTSPKLISYSQQQLLKEQKELLLQEKQEEQKQQKLLDQRQNQHQDQALRLAQNDNQNRIQHQQYSSFKDNTKYAISNPNPTSASSAQHIFIPKVMTRNSSFLRKGSKALESLPSLNNSQSTHLRYHKAKNGSNNNWNNTHSISFHLNSSTPTAISDQQCKDVRHITNLNTFSIPLSFEKNQLTPKYLQLNTSFKERKKIQEAESEPEKLFFQNRFLGEKQHLLLKQSFTNSSSSSSFYSSSQTPQHLLSSQGFWNKHQGIAGRTLVGQKISSTNMKQYQKQLNYLTKLKIKPTLILNKDPNQQQSPKNEDCKDINVLGEPLEKPIRSGSYSEFIKYTLPHSRRKKSFNNQQIHVQKGEHFYQLNDDDYAELTPWSSG